MKVKELFEGELPIFHDIVKSMVESEKGLWIYIKVINPAKKKEDLIIHSRITRTEDMNAVVSKDEDAAVARLFFMVPSSKGDKESWVELNPEDGPPLIHIVQMDGKRTLVNSNGKPL